VDLFEYQARDLFEAHEVPVLPAEVVTQAADAGPAAERVGAGSGGVVVVKAQVKVGGRGKAGGVKLARSAEEAVAAAEQILGMDIKGHTVGAVMIAQGAKIAEEYYFSLLLDRTNRSLLAMCSKEGGVDIETLAVERPEALAKVPVDANTGIDEATARTILTQAGFDEDEVAQMQSVLVALWDVYKGEDATLVEVNPMVRTEDGQVLALDGKVTLDENARFRHEGHASLVDQAAADPLEAKATELGLN
jgi:succinyl-CoA synthetase beta subunit